MNLWRRLKTLWWLSGQVFTSQPAESKNYIVGNMLKKRPASIVEPHELLDRINLQ